MENEGRYVEASVEFDRIIDALGSHVRRRILVELLDHNPVEYGELIGGGVKRDRREREIEMTHVHLPKLDEMGFISWDRDRRTVLKGAAWNEIEPTLRVLRENSEQLPDDVF